MTLLAGIALWLLTADIADASRTHPHLDVPQGPMALEPPVPLFDVTHLTANMEYAIEVPRSPLVHTKSTTLRDSASKNILYTLKQRRHVNLDTSMALTDVAFNRPYVCVVTAHKDVSMFTQISSDGLHVLTTQLHHDGLRYNFEYKNKKYRWTVRFGEGGTYRLVQDMEQGNEWELAVLRKRTGVKADRLLTKRATLTVNDAWVQRAESERGFEDFIVATALFIVM